MLWSVVPKGVKSYSLSTRIGLPVKLKKHGHVAVLITPTAYVPPSLPCPALTIDGLCSIHASKPLRCLTMPFYPYREESDQSDLLKPRSNWECDTSFAAPLVYHNRSIVDRSNFDKERLSLLDQSATMAQYAEYMMKYNPSITDRLALLAIRPDGNLITSLSSFLNTNKHLDAKHIATQQLSVLENFALKTAKIPELAEYNKNYSGWAMEMRFITKSL